MLPYGAPERSTYTWMGLGFLKLVGPRFFNQFALCWLMTSYTERLCTAGGNSLTMILSVEASESLVCDEDPHAPVPSDKTRRRTVQRTYVMGLLGRKAK